MAYRKAFWVLVVSMLIIIMVSLLPAQVFAKNEPPDDLLYHVMQQRVVHDKKCTVRNIKEVECLVLADVMQGLLWIVLFDNDLKITHVYAAQGEKLEMVWVRDDLTT